VGANLYMYTHTLQLPPHDVLMTSPPYSADHIGRLLQHAASATVPWVRLLAPNPNPTLTLTQ